MARYSAMFCIRYIIVSSHILPITLSKNICLKQCTHQNPNSTSSVPRLLYAIFLSFCIHWNVDAIQSFWYSRNVFFLLFHSIYRFRVVSVSFVLIVFALWLEVAFNSIIYSVWLVFFGSFERRFVYIGCKFFRSIEHESLSHNWHSQNKFYFTFDLTMPIGNRIFYAVAFYLVFFVNL